MDGLSLFFFQPKESTMSQEMMSRVAEEIRHQRREQDLQVALRRNAEIRRQRWQDSLDEFYKKQEEEAQSN